MNTYFIALQYVPFLVRFSSSRSHQTPGLRELALHLAVSLCTLCFIAPIFADLTQPNFTKESILGRIKLLGNNLNGELVYCTERGGG
jgi:hypothetical protein